MANDEFGDFQTPEGLVVEVLSTLQLNQFDRILEPTCGVGNFLRGVKNEHPDAEFFGVEIQEQYAAAAKSYGNIIVADAMKIDFGRDIKWSSTGSMLVIGNPPWVTNAALTALGSENKPKLANIRGLSGLDALTGASNFDIAEAIILKLIAELSDQSPTIAMLCKTQVARNILSYCAQFNLGVANSQVYEIDAKKWFNAGVDACLFILKLETGTSNYIADVFPTLSSTNPTKQIGVVGGRLVSDVDKYVHTKSADGESPLVWRQGIKHDSTMTMELVESNGPHKKTGERVDIELDFLYPMLKCTDVFRGRTIDLSKWMVVPQRHTGDDTSKLKTIAPKLWGYLVEHGDALDNRKSSIYRNRARFCIFGVGEYSFAPYKVAVSAMHKEPIFRLVAPIDGRPVVFDDVCYFTSFQTLGEAAIVWAIMQSKPAQDLITSLCFTDSKRPITKKLLQRLDLNVLAGLTPEKVLVTAALQICAETNLSISSESLNTALRELKVSWRGELNEALFQLEDMRASSS